jgi:hypothetical protein
MTRTEHRSIRLTAETVAKAKELANLWKPSHLATRISLADVMSTCIDRVHELDARKQERKPLRIRP